ncbi:MAG: VanZ family protein [Rhodocyclaceae bacterium]|nr:VanZ family protein [Rhodocyclaceae bacterium]
MRPHTDSASLARSLALAYLLLVLYASLYPVVTWRDNGAPLFEFLFARWPRYWTGLDLGLNVAGYLPLGFLLTSALTARFKPGRAALLALLFSSALSLAMEVLQNYLPSRVSSNVDLATNTLGAFLGVLMGLRWGGALRVGGAVHRWRMRRLHRGKLTDFGLVLLLLWLLTQISPEILLFGTGSLRGLLGFAPALDFTAERFRTVETWIAASGALGVGLLAWRLMRRPSRWLLATLFLLALLVRSGAAMALMTPDDLLRWATPGALAGLAWGLILLYGATFLPRVWQQSLGALALLFATILVNLAPENPYLLHSLHIWRQGHFLNFNGLTRLASSLWPLFALSFLVAAGPGRESRETPPV